MYQNIVETLVKYGDIFRDDKDLPKFQDFLNNPENFGANCVNRKNFNGHITVSSLVIKDDEVLVLWHKTFQKYLQPGGHIDPPDESPVSAAIREVKEETGVDVVPCDGIFSDIPISIDAHPIPANQKKQEDAHIHFDLFFLLKVKDTNQKISNTDAGVDDAKWVKISELKTDNDVLSKGIEKYKNYFKNSL